MKPNRTQSPGAGNVGAPAGNAPPLAEPMTAKRPHGSAAPWPVRCWLALPDWSFRLIGAGFFFGYLVYRAPDYWTRFWELGPYYQFADGERLQLPWTRVLIDLTYVLIGLAYVFRLPPRSRANRGGAILVAMVGATWPFLPFLFQAILGLIDSPFAADYAAFMWKTRLSLTTTLVGAALVLFGNALDVWGYGTLFKSISIVPEARVLKVTGPYRLVRHPIYLGQMMAQAGVWLCFARTHVIWIGFYLCFVGFQLYRARLEDRVLEAAFGERYAAWKRKTFWFG